MYAEFCLAERPPHHIIVHSCMWFLFGGQIKKILEEYGPLFLIQIAGISCSALDMVAG